MGRPHHQMMDGEGPPGLSGSPPAQRCQAASLLLRCSSPDQRCLAGGISLHLKAINNGNGVNFSCLSGHRAAALAGLAHEDVPFDGSSFTTREEMAHVQVSAAPAFESPGF